MLRLRNRPFECDHFALGDGGFVDAVSSSALAATRPDLLDLTRQLVEIPSESFHEAAITDAIDARLRGCRHLHLTRVGDNLVARTDLGRPQRVVLAGHTDTVPATTGAPPRVEGDVLWGVGSTDMKGGLAVFLDAAERFTAPVVDVTYVFYAREEVASAHSGLGELIAERADLLIADLALLGEPTDGAIEAGCQGSIRVEVTLNGQRAHTARAWMGRNAIHRLGPLLDSIADYEPRTPLVEGCRYHEAMQVVAVSGGVAGNVVPDRVTFSLAHRFAPDRSTADAEEEVRSLLAPFLDLDDTVDVVDRAPAALPGLAEPVLRNLIDDEQLEVRAKLGWTDVARFSELGVPASNFGPGDPLLAHTADERVSRASLERCAAVIERLLTGAAERR